MVRTLFHRSVTAAVAAAGLLFFLQAAVLRAEHRSTVELDLYSSAARAGGDSWVGMGAGIASYRLQQTENPNVRSLLEISALFTPTPSGGPDASFDVEKAYAKFRFADMRGTIGKAPFSWGEGLIFNVADSMFSRGTGADLMQSEFEDAAAWLTGLSWYFGPFSFVEFIAIPAPLEAIVGDSSESEVTAGYGLPALEDYRAGIRWIAKPMGIKTELGYLFDGRDGTGPDDSSAAGSEGGSLQGDSAAFQEGAFYHRPYFSLQGNIGIDWHLSASLELPDRGAIFAGAWEGFLISSGLYSLIPVGYDDSLGFRVETLTRPAGEWEERHIEDESGGTASPASYGLYSYGEVSYDFGTGFSLALRSLISPIDLSAKISPGLSWNIFQGFTLLGYASFQTGDGGDTYPWDPPATEATSTSGGISAGSSGASVMIGCNVVY